MWAVPARSEGVALLGYPRASASPHASYRTLKRRLPVYRNSRGGGSCPLPERCTPAWAARAHGHGSLTGPPPCTTQDTLPCTGTALLLVLQVPLLMRG